MTDTRKCPICGSENAPFEREGIWCVVNNIKDYPDILVITQAKRIAQNNYMEFPQDDESWRFWYKLMEMLDKAQKTLSP